MKIKSTPTFGAAFFVVAAMGITGCASVETNVPNAVVNCGIPAGRAAPKGPALVGQEYGMVMSAIPVDAVQFTDQRIANTVAVQALFAARSPTETVQVTARFVNCFDHPVAVRVRTSFMRNNLAPSEPTSAWQTVILRLRATGTYSENSTGRTEVAHYLLEIASEY